MLTTRANNVRIGQAGEDRSGGTNAEWARTDLQRAQSQGAPGNVIQALNDDLNRAERVQTLSAAFLDPAEVLIELSIAERRGATPAIVEMYRNKFTTAMARVSPAPPPPPLPGLPPGGIPAGSASDSPLDRRGGLDDLPAAILVTSPLWATLFWLWRRRR